MMLYQLGGSAQHRIAESMAIAVVDILEMIEVHGKKADRTIWSGFGQYPVGNTLKRSPVGQARKSVTAGFGKELRFAAEVAALPFDETTQNQGQGDICPKDQGHIA